MSYYLRCFMFFAFKYESPKRAIRIPWCDGGTGLKKNKKPDQDCSFLCLQETDRVPPQTFGVFSHYRCVDDKKKKKKIIILITEKGFLIHVHN